MPGITKVDVVLKEALGAEDPLENPITCSTLTPPLHLRSTLDADVRLRAEVALWSRRAVMHRRLTFTVVIRRWTRRPDHRRIDARSKYPLGRVEADVVLRGSAAT
jgi:hypothetical protein